VSIDIEKYSVRKASIDKSKVLS